MNSVNLTEPTTPSTTVVAYHEAKRDIFILLLYGITTLVAIIGNLFICHTLYRKKRLTSTTYILIFNMAISDVLAGVTIPGQWIFCSTAILGDPDSGSGDESACGTMKIAQILSFYASSLTMAMIAFDRYRMICTPMVSRIRVRYLVISIWTLGIMFISICVTNLRVTEYFPEEGIVMTCRVLFKTTFGQTLRRIRPMALIVTQYVFPLIFTGIFYAFVAKRIWTRAQMGAAANDAKRREKFNAKKRRTIKMLIIVTVMFALSYFPTHVYHVLMFYTNVIPVHRNTCYTSTLYALCYWLAINSCALNPFIYCYYNTEFRNEALRYWRTIIALCGRGPSDGQETNVLGNSSSSGAIDSGKTESSTSDPIHAPPMHSPIATIAVSMPPPPAIDTMRTSTV